MKKNTFIVLLFFVLMATGCQQRTDEEVITLYTSKAEASEKIDVDHNKKKIRVALASVISPKESLSKYEYLLGFIESELDVDLEIIQKQKYEEVDQMLEAGEVDFAFICSLSYVIGLKNEYIVDVAAPVVNNRPFYQSYTIVNQNSSYERLEELEGKKFAYTDPYSYTGRLSMLSQLNKMGRTSEEFFGNTYFTYSHDYSVKAVQLGIVDGATVDSVIFDQLLNDIPQLKSQIKIIGTGEEAGTPPVVASKKVDSELVERFSSILFDLHNHVVGREMLNNLGVDQYVPIDQGNYRVIQEELVLLGDSI